MTLLCANWDNLLFCNLPNDHVYHNTECQNILLQKDLDVCTPAHKPHDLSTSPRIYNEKLNTFDMIVVRGHQFE